MRIFLSAEAICLLLGLAGTLVFDGVPLDVSLLGTHLDVDGAGLAQRGAHLDFALYLAVQGDLAWRLGCVFALAMRTAQERQQLHLGVVVNDRGRSIHMDASLS